MVPPATDHPMRAIFISNIRAGLVLIGAGAFEAAGQSVELLPPITVLAERRLGEEPAAPLAEWTREDLREAAPGRSMKCWRRSRRSRSIDGSRRFPPTRQPAGVSLRNTGATAASRTLVLLDGIPQNDPFGGWVYWARYDAATLDSIRIVPAARAAVWGNQSPAGVIQMNGYPAFENRPCAENRRRQPGDHQRLDGQPDDQRGENAGGALFRLRPAYRWILCGGFLAARPHRPQAGHGPGGANLKFSWLAAPGLTVEPMVSWYTEERGNGTGFPKTPLTRWISRCGSARRTAIFPGRRWPGSSGGSSTRFSARSTTTGRRKRSR